MCVGLGTSAALKLSPSLDAEGHDGLCERSGSANEFDSDARQQPNTFKRDAAASSSGLDFTPLLEARSLDGMRVGLRTSAELKPAVAADGAVMVPQYLCDQASLNDHADPLLTSVQPNSFRVMAKPSASSSLPTGSKTPKVSNCGSSPHNSLEKPFPPGFDAYSSASRPKIHGRSRTKDREVQKLLFIELCAGTAILSRTAASAGFRTFPVDNSRVRAPHKSVHLLDLAVPEQQAALIELIRNERDAIALLFAAPSCGTASRAREKPLPSWKRKGFAIPQPLRSDDHPDMLPGLSGLDRKKVELANQLYDALSLIMIEAHSLSVPIMIENPANSLYWSTTFFLRLASFAQGHFVKFHNCCHGGARPKLTAFWTTVDWFDHLAILCDGSHVHKSWRPLIKNRQLHFVTGEEAAYPPLLCQRIVSATLQNLYAADPSQNTFLTQAQAGDAAVHRVVLGKQPRGNKLKPLVAEFGSYKSCVFPARDVTFLDSCIQNCPKGSRVTSRRILKWGMVQSDMDCSDFEISDLLKPGSVDADSLVEVCHIGIPCIPEEFVRRAIKAGHPHGADVHLSQEVDDAVDWNFKGPLFDLAKLRVEFFKTWTARAECLAQKEKDLHATFPLHLQHVLKGKRLLLLQEMMSAAGCPDSSLVQDICSGFRLSGWMTDSGNFKPSVKSPEYDLDCLRRISAGLNDAVWGKLSRRQEPDLESKCWEETLSELANRWVWIDAHPPRVHCLAMRFGLNQGSKVRVIDDCSIAGVNRTVGLRERFELHTIDKLAAMIASGFSKHGSGHFKRCVGRTFDLKSAYKQFGIHPVDRDLLRILVRSSEDGELKVLGLNALPFGAIGSVAAFLRISVCLWRIGVVLLKLFWTSFFDDFSCISSESLASNAQWAVESLFTLLGISFAIEGKKAEPFGQCFRMLGLQVDVTCSSNLQVHIGHTPERREELLEFLDSILVSGWLDYKTCERLRGRMVFFEGFAFGRVSCTALRTICNSCKNASGKVQISTRVEFCLKWLADRIRVAEPLCIMPATASTWIVFTDGACNAEARTGGVGGILFCPEGSAESFFGEQVPESVMNHLFSFSENPIYELELAPLLLSLQLWGERMKGSQVVFYLDNEGARHSMIRLFAEHPFADSIVQRFLRLEQQFQLRIWFGRVPTASNPADDPSRMSFEVVASLGAAREKPALQSLLVVGEGC